MNISRALQYYSQQLQNVSETPLLDIEILLSEILGSSKAQLVAYPERKLDPQQEQQLQKWVARRYQGEPIAYLVGHQPFWTLDLKVTPATLIPRPETELLVEWVLQATQKFKTLYAIDLGVGSGAIALSLAKERPLWQIAAIDISAEALAVAEENAKLHAVHNVRFYQGSWLAPITKERKYQLIVSNPPYIAENDEHLKKLQFEPYSALVSEQQGLADIQQIIDGAKDYLQPGGLLVIEHGYDQGHLVCQRLLDAGYSAVLGHLDLAKQPRFVTAYWE